MASDGIIEEIKQRVDLVDFVGQHLDLKRAGRTYKACCPFHTENTPSFVIFPHTNTWHCFGACGEGGDVFTYLQKREGLDFSEALRQLARVAGVALAEESETQQQARAERERLRACCEAATQQFQSWLYELPAAQLCRDYIERRGLTPEVVHHFTLGYAPDSWDALFNALTARGYQPADLLRVGLVRERESGGYYDTLRHRLIFPIRDARGRVVGFGGRALEEGQEPKYLNSPQTELFDKGQTLYGLDLAKDQIRNEDRAVLVEGYMDVIAAHQMGFTNVIASLGTALTGDQLRLLRRYAPNLVLALDADEAGLRAAVRGLETVLDVQQEIRRERWERARQGRGAASDVEGDVRVLLLPEGLDPDDLVRQAPERWRALLAAALPVMDFWIQQRLRGVDLEDPVQKTRVVADLLPRVRDLDSVVLRDHYIQRLARLLRVDERSLVQEMVALPRPRQAEPRPARPAAPPSAPSWQEGPPPPPPDEYGEYPAGESYFDRFGDVPEGDEGAARSIPPPAPPPIEPSTAPSSPGAEPRELEAYLLYLFVEYPHFLAQAEADGVRPDMWQQTEHRQIWEALLRHRPESAVFLEEFLAELDEPVAQRLRRIVAFYAAHPPIDEPEVWEVERWERLQAFWIRYNEQQARQLHYLLDDMQRTLDADPAAVRALLQQRSAVQQDTLRRQKLVRDRARAQKRAQATP